MRQVRVDYRGAKGTSVVRFVLWLRSGWNNCMLFRIHQIVHFKGVNFIPQYLGTSTLKGTTDRCNSENIPNIIKEVRLKWVYAIWFPFMNSRIELRVERIKSKWLSGMRQEQAVYREEVWGIFWGHWWVCSVDRTEGCMHLTNSRIHQSESFNTPISLCVNYSS